MGKEQLAALAHIIELDSDMMHAVMQTSNPPLLYWQAATVDIFHAVRDWRAAGLAVAYTVDAGPNVHVICPREVQKEAERRLREIPGVSDVLLAHVGGAARLVEVLVFPGAHHEAGAEGASSDDQGVFWHY